MLKRIIFILLFSVTNYTVFSQEIKITNTFSPAGRSGYFKWTIFIMENQAVLNTIDHVEYLLNATFATPQVSSFDRENNFSYSATGWGEFEIRVKIVFKGGQKPPKYCNYWLHLK